MDPFTEIPALIQRLRSRSRVQQAAAVRTLKCLAFDSSDARQAIIAAGGVPPLMQLLRDSSSLTALEHAVAALAGLALDYSSSLTSEVAAALPLVVRLLAWRGPIAEHSTALLSNLTASCQERRDFQVHDAIVAAGGVPALVPLIENGTATEQLAAVMTLANLTGVRLEAASSLVAAGGLPPLLQLLDSQHKGVPESAARVLQSVAHISGDAAGAAGAIPRIIQALRSSSSLIVRKAAAGAVADIACQHSIETAALLSEGMLPPLVALLSSGDDEAQHNAAVALRNLCCEGSDSCVAVAAAGAVPDLLACLRSGNEAVVDHATTALNTIAASHGSQKKAIVAAGAISAADDALAQCQDDEAQQALSELKTCLLLPAGVAAPASAAASPVPSRPPAPRICAAPGCGATRGLRRCGGCRAVRYCSEACCRAHWKSHKAECRRVQAQRAAAGAREP